MNLEEYVDVAHRNSYDVIINNKDAKNLIIRDDGYFIHHPAEPVTNIGAMLFKGDILFTKNLLYYFK